MQFFSTKAKTPSKTRPQPASLRIPVQREIRVANMYHPWMLDSDSPSSCSSSPSTPRDGQPIRARSAMGLLSGYDNCADTDAAVDARVQTRAIRTPAGTGAGTVADETGEESLRASVDAEVEGVWRTRGGLGASLTESQRHGREDRLERVANGNTRRGQRDTEKDFPASQAQRHRHERELRYDPKQATLKTPKTALTFAAVWDPEHGMATFTGDRLLPLDLDRPETNHTQSSDASWDSAWYPADRFARGRGEEGELDEGFFDTFGHPDCEPHLPSRFSTSTTSTSAYIHVPNEADTDEFRTADGHALEHVLPRSSSASSCGGHPDISAPFSLMPVRRKSEGDDPAAPSRSSSRGSRGPRTRCGSSVHRARSLPRKRLGSSVSRSGSDAGSRRSRAGTPVPVPDVPVVPALPPLSSLPAPPSHTHTSNPSASSAASEPAFPTVADDHRAASPSPDPHHVSLPRLDPLDPLLLQTSPLAPQYTHLPPPEPPREPWLAMPRVRKWSLVRMLAGVGVAVGPKDGDMKEKDGWVSIEITQVVSHRVVEI